MKVLVAGKSKKIVQFFAVPCEFLNFEKPDDFKKLKLENDMILYIDRSSYSKEIYNKIIDIVKIKNYCWGILDPKNQIDDPAQLFFLGAADYLGKLALEQKVTNSRICAINTFKNGENTEKIELLHFPGWEKLIPKHEYPFIFLIVSLNLSEEQKKNLGDKRVEYIKNLFVNYLLHIIQDIGVLWMSDGNYALLLFPPEQSEFALRVALQTIINAIPLAYEYYKIPYILPLTFALHYGTTPWEKAGKTGNIISSDINFIHHVIKKSAKPNVILVSQEFMELIPEKHKAIFIEDKSFEGHLLYRSIKYNTIKKHK